MVALFTFILDAEDNPQKEEDVSLVNEKLNTKIHLLHHKNYVKQVKQSAHVKIVACGSHCDSLEKLDKIGGANQHWGVVVIL